jgi:pyrroloquinoline-quinone synthase
VSSTASGLVDEAVWTTDEFVDALRAQGSRYHHLHPFHVRMNAGEL